MLYSDSCAKFFILQDLALPFSLLFFLDGNKARSRRVICGNLLYLVFSFIISLLVALQRGTLHLKIAYLDRSYAHLRPGAFFDP